MHTLPPQTAGQLPFDRSWFLHVNELARDTPWLHAPARGYASYGVVLFLARTPLRVLVTAGPATATAST